MGKLSSKIDITAAGVPAFDDSKAYEEAAKKNRDNMQATKDLKKNLDGVMKMLKGYTSQVTPGDFKSKNCIDGKC